VYNIGDGLDRIVDASGNDKIQLGAGLTLENVALRVSTTNGVSTAHMRLLDADGCEIQTQGVDFAVTIDPAGNITPSIESFLFANGTLRGFNDVLIKTATTVMANSATSLVTGRDDDIIYGNSKKSTISSGSGNDVVYAGSQGDTVYGQGGDDYLVGGNGNDTLDGGCGNNVIDGGKGDDLVTVAGFDESSALLGGQGKDTLVGGDASDFLAGGASTDLIKPGAGHNIIAFNGGDGQDTVVPAAGAANTLSLGQDVDQTKLFFSKSGDDLVLQGAGNSQVAFQGWYASSANQNFVTLQILHAVDASGSTGIAGVHHVEMYDFQGLVTSFDRARAANPTLTSWGLMNGLLDAHLASSDDAAIGGDLANYYSQFGSLSGMGLNAAQQVLKDPQFGAAQVLHANSEVQQSAVRLV
jgi:Ca2+-binding RTX toxin-like protein